jgi:hypothetical protein
MNVVAFPEPCAQHCFAHEKNFNANNKAMLVAKRIFAILKLTFLIDTSYIYVS